MKNAHTKLTTVSVRELYTLYKKGQLTLSDPRFQRNAVINDERKSKLVALAFNPNFELRDIGVIHIAIVNIEDSITSENIKTFNILDGQQRLTAIFGFLNDTVQLPDHFTIHGEEYKLESNSQELGGKKFKHLNKENKDLILDFEIGCKQYINYSDEYLPTLFKNINDSINLNDQEQRNSYPTKSCALFRELSRDLQTIDIGEINIPEYLLGSGNYHYKNNNIDNTRLAMEAVQAHLFNISTYNINAIHKSEYLDIMYNSHLIKDITDSDISNFMKLQGYINNCICSAIGKTTRIWNKDNIIGLGRTISYIYSNKGKIHDFELFTKSFINLVIEYKTKIKKKELDNFLAQTTDEYVQLYFKNIIEPLLITKGGKQLGQTLTGVTIRDPRRKFSKDIVEQKLIEQDYKCAVSGVDLRQDGIDYEADHIIRWEVGGPTTIENCQIITEDENRKKHY